MKYVLSTYSGFNFLIQPSQRGVIRNLMAAGNRGTIEIGDEMIAITDVKGIYTENTFFIQENEKLRLKRMIRCKTCMRINDISVGCVCRDEKKLRQNVFELRSGGLKQLT
tara:strand:- start:76 stop:405 length:330 start_codon:yes stop_codon:yes gene_type:complete